MYNAENANNNLILGPARRRTKTLQKKKIKSFRQRCYLVWGYGDHHRTPLQIRGPVKKFSYKLKRRGSLTVLPERVFKIGFRGCVDELREEAVGGALF